MADPRIEDVVEEVDEEVHEDEADGEDHDAELHDEESRRKMAWTVRSPMPGKAKMVSTMMAPR